MPAAFGRLSSPRSRRRARRPRVGDRRPRCGRAGRAQIAAHGPRVRRDDDAGDAPAAHRDRQPRRHMLLTQRAAWRHRARCRRSRKDRRIVGGHAVDDGEARLDRRAVPGVDRAVDRGREDDAAALLQAHEGSRQAGLSGREARPGDGDQAPAVGEARQRRRDMAQAASATRPSTLATPRTAGSSARRWARRRHRDGRRSGRRRSA